MKLFLLLLLSVLQRSLIYSQPENNSPVTKQATTTGNVYAVVIGISTYENKNIPDLNFSGNDAVEFSSYLMSKAGGAVPAANIKLLVNEKATMAAIYDALYWLNEKCESDKEDNPAAKDLVYFYFSGHGDIENVTLKQLGYLLAYNTPANNYINNAVRLEDLNFYANKLSESFKADVVLITDACHSGKLAGDNFGGTKQVSRQLGIQRAKEIRIASCTPEEISHEDKGWGGGRSVFSFYLVNGLEGFADKNNDSTVTLIEVKNYLNASLASDSIMKALTLKQTPVLEGDNNFKLAEVDNDRLKELIDKISLTTFLSPKDEFFALLNQSGKIEQLDYDRILRMPAESIPFGFIEQAKNLPDAEPGVLDEFAASLRNDKEALDLFRSDLVEFLHTSGQKVINLYIAGDEAELERRRYYNSASNGYDIYPKMYLLALKLVSPDHPLHNILEVNYHYFSGVNMRLKMPLIADPAPLLAKALAEQKKAMALLADAAYIQNEMGVLYLYKKEYAVAEKYFIQATRIAPEWSIPFSNLVAVYSKMKELDKALEKAKQAERLSPLLQNAYVNEGIVYQQKGNMLLAEELFRKSIKLNSRHYLPFEGLGYVYLATTQYQQADSFFNEADIRKAGFHMPPEDNVYSQLATLAPQVMDESICFIDEKDVTEKDATGQFALAMESYLQQDSAKAESGFKKVIALDRSNPLAFYYLGKLFYEQRRWQEAEIALNLAVTYHLARNDFNHYVDSVSAKMPATPSKKCIITTFRDHYYNKINNHYFLADLYETWNHFSEAAQQYHLILQIDPVSPGGYYKLWNLLEKTARFRDAEEVIHSFMIINKEDGERELHQFYTRMTEMFPGDGDWYYKQGAFLYHYAERIGKDELYAHDYIDLKPDTDPESIDLENIQLSSRTEYEEPRGKRIFLPGTREAFSLADPITFPGRKALSSLVKANKLLGNDPDAQLDINSKIGDLCVWIGLTDLAAPYYTRALQLDGTDAGTRQKLADVCSATWQLQAAMLNLDTLYQFKEIDFGHQVLLAKYFIHWGKFDEAVKLLATAQAAHPYKIDEITELNGRLQYMAARPKLAIPFYIEYLTTYPKDSCIMYSMARSYSLSGNQPEALKWLEKAVNNGFRYYWVMKYDTAWNKYRSNSKWIALQKRMPVPDNRKK